MNRVILLDSNMHEISEISIDVDCEVGVGSDVANDFELSNATIQQLDARGFYLPNSEIGGLFEYSKMTTESNVKVFRGFSWRGLLQKSLILPPSGSDYRIVSGNVQEIIADLLSNALGGFFHVPADAEAVNISNYQFPLYISLADGIEGMLETIGYRLDIYAKKLVQGGAVQVFCQAVPAETVSGSFNGDSELPLIYEENNMGINHLLCAGQGELQSRMKVDLYMDENGNVSETPYYTGFQERTEFYDYSSAESRDDLVDSGTKRLKELASAKILSVQSMANLDLSIGDKVRAIFPDGSQIVSPIVKKIYKISGGILTTEVEVKGEN